MDIKIKLEFKDLIGKRIISASSWEHGDKEWKICTDNWDYTLQIDDDSCGGLNDSWACISSITGFKNIIDKVITRVHESANSYSAEITLFAQDSICSIDIIHQHNGYYGFSYILSLV